MIPTVAVAAALCSVAIATSTANGVADPNGFDHGGRVATIGGLAWPSGREQTAVTGDGRIYVAAVRGEGAEPEGVCVRRFRPDGELDRGFGAAGTVHIGELGSGNFRFDDLLVDADGSPYLVGSTEDGETVVARLRPDGSLDPTYGEGGVARLDSAQTSGDRPRSVIDQSNRVIVAANRTVARLSSSGKLDPTFGTDGKVPLPDGAVASLGVDAEGRVQIALPDRGDDGTGFRLIRLDEDGRPSGSLGATGACTFPGIGAVRAMAVRSDGSTLVVGTATRRQRGGVTVPLMSIGSRGLQATVPRWVHHSSVHLRGRSYVSGVVSDPNGDDYLVGIQVIGRRRGLVVDLDGEQYTPRSPSGEHQGGEYDSFGKNQQVVLTSPGEVVARGASFTGSGGTLLVDGITRPPGGGAAHAFLAEVPAAEQVIYYAPEVP
jgi:uncharacterized delta-60 repeat protein